MMGTEYKVIIYCVPTKKNIPAVIYCNLNKD